MRALLLLGDLLHNTLAVLRNLLVSLTLPRGPLYVLLELTGPYPEHRTPGPWWSRQPPSVEDVRRQLDVLAANRHVAGVVVTARDLGAGLASVQSLRAALATYRAGGGRVVAYLVSASTRVYYLASVADLIVMPESGVLDLRGVTLEATFLGDALTRLGVRGELEQVGAFKGAAEPFVRSSMSPDVREQLNMVLDSLFEDLVSDIARARGLDPARVRELIDGAPHPARRAREAGLVDALLFEDELADYLGKKGRPPAIVPWTIARHRLRRRLRWRAGTKAVALVSVRGVIQLGETRPRLPVPLPLLGTEVAGHASVARALRAAARSPLFGAIVLTVESPGGSAAAADLIWREVERARRRKPVVAFLGNVAASGGYYVAAGATRIVCQPASVTGSIGVVGGKFTVGALATRAGLRREILARGNASTMASPWRPLSAEERDRLRSLMRDVYDRFVDRVAAGRGMAREDVLRAADGRLWTGRQALELRLVDALGDFAAAVQVAKDLMGVPARKEVAVVPVRPSRTAPGTRGSWRTALAAWVDLHGLAEEGVLALVPWELRVR